MATTSIWRVGGWLGKVVIYVENPDKTENPAVYEKTDMEGRDTHRASRMSSNTPSNSKRRKKSQPMTKEPPSCSGLCPG